MEGAQRGQRGPVGVTSRAALAVLPVGGGGRRGLKREGGEPPTPLGLSMRGGRDDNRMWRGTGQMPDNPACLLLLEWEEGRCQTPASQAAVAALAQRPAA